MGFLSEIFYQADDEGREEEELVMMRLPASSVLLFTQNQRGGTVSAQPAMPMMRPTTAATHPSVIASDDGSSSRYNPPRTNAIGLINWNIQRNAAIRLLI